MCADMSTRSLGIMGIITDQSTCRKWSTFSLKFQISEWVWEAQPTFKGAMVVVATVVDMAETSLAMEPQLLMGQGALTPMSM